MKISIAEAREKQDGKRIAFLPQGWKKTIKCDLPDIYYIDYKRNELKLLWSK
jgi:hypothetical protein